MYKYNQMKVDKKTGVSLAVVFAAFGIFSWFTDKIDNKADKIEVEKV